MVLRLCQSQDTGGMSIQNAYDDTKKWAGSMKFKENKILEGYEVLDLICRHWRKAVN